MKHDTTLQFRGLDYSKALNIIASKLGYRVKPIIIRYDDDKNAMTSYFIGGYDVECESERLILCLDQLGQNQAKQLSAKVIIQHLSDEYGDKLGISAGGIDYYIVQLLSSINPPKRADNTRKTASKKTKKMDTNTSISHPNNTDKQVNVIVDETYKDGKNNKHNKASTNNIPSSDTIKTVTKYSVSNTIRATEELICPVCGKRMTRERFNVPVYRVNGNFHAYYVCNLLNCSRCNKQIMSDVEWKNLLVRITKERKEVRVSPTNMRFVSGTRSTRYIYEPIGNDKKMITSYKKPQPINPEIRTMDMKSRSFLKDAGYSTKVSEQLRRKILQQQVNKYGKRIVADYLRTFIALHKRRTQYQNAVSIWQADLNYIARL